MFAKSLSRVRLFATSWTVARQAPLSVGFSRQEYWRGLPCPPPGDLPDPGIDPASPALLSHQRSLLVGRWGTTSPCLEHPTRWTLDSYTNYQKTMGNHQETERTRRGGGSQVGGVGMSPGVKAVNLQEGEVPWGQAVGKVGRVGMWEG